MTFQTQEQVEQMAEKIYHGFLKQFTVPKTLKYSLARYVLSLLLPCKEALESVLDELGCEEHGRTNCPSFIATITALAKLKEAGL